MAAPRLSVVLVTDAYETIQPVVARLAQQTVRDAIELVIVGPTGTPLAPERGELAGFAAVRVIELEAIEPLAPARAEGVRAATAPIVFLGETHTYPYTDWAEALIAAHAEGWTGVVPMLRNANPDGAISWANLLFDYGPWCEGRPAGEVERVPIYNTSYKRSVLLEFEDLESLLTSGNELVLRLRAKGHRLYFEPAARIDHVNVSRPRAWIEERYVAGVMIAGSRLEHWSRGRRLLHACTWPAIPLVLLSRLVQPVRRLRARQPLPRGTYGVMLVSAVVTAFGEAVGYIRGAGTSAEPRLTEYELHKVRYTAGGPR
jgi:hypothetical protein